MQCEEDICTFEQVLSVKYLSEVCTVASKITRKAALCLSKLPYCCPVEVDRLNIAVSGPFNLASNLARCFSNTFGTPHLIASW